MKQALLIMLERYLGVLARIILLVYKPCIIGVTGSVGKTTTTQAIANLLATAKLPTLTTQGNLNADLGLALTVLGYDHSPAIYEWPWTIIYVHYNWLLMVLRIKSFPPYFVAEMGIDRLGDMRRMVKMIRPTVGIVTWIGEGHHLEFLKDPKTIAKEKGVILTVLPADGLAIIPAKDEQVNILEKMASAPIKKISKTGLEALPEIVQKVGDFLLIDQKIIDKAIRTYKQPKGRLTQLKGIHNSLLIDDTYNSSLPSVKLALDVLGKTKGKRKIAILGDILEQGKAELDIHQQVSRLAKQRADLFIGVGKRFYQVKTDQWYASPDEAAAALLYQVKAGDVILIKGSQGMRMEKVSYALAADKKQAIEMLPRQNKRWQQLPFRNP